MKATISIALIILLFSQCLFKLGTLVYFNINQQYIAEVLCVNKNNQITRCHGKCFLNKKLALADETQEKSVPVNNVKFEITVFIGPENGAALFVSVEDIVAQTFYNIVLKTNFESFLFRPPAYQA